MNRILGILAASLFFAAPMVMAQESGHMDHVELGAFVNYYRMTDPGPTKNFLGLGARAAFGIRPSIQLEAEMAYDFKRNYTSTYNNGVSTSAVTTRLRTLHGFFGPKFQTGLRMRLDSAAGLLTSHSIPLLVSKPSPDPLA